MHKPSATLLIIDDDDVVRASLAAYLDDSGFKVLQAPNGPRGVELFDAEHPDLVICDLRMPQMDGLELIRLISERQADLPGLSPPPKPQALSAGAAHGRCGLGRRSGRARSEERGGPLCTAGLPGRQRGRGGRRTQS